MLISRRGIAVLAAGIALAMGIRPSPSGAEDSKPESKGLELTLELPDGDKWTLGEKGIGRPFLARLILSNRSEEDIRVWDALNSEGSMSPSITLTNALTTRGFLLRPLYINRPSGIASFWTIKPHESRVVELELLRLVEECSPREGPYKITAQYDNTLDHRAGIKNVWTGHISSVTKNIQIVAPGHKP